MPKMKRRLRWGVLGMTVALLRLYSGETTAGTVALWLFDEPMGFYPSVTLRDDAKDNRVSGLEVGAEIVAGKFGHALRPMKRPTARGDGARDPNVAARAVVRPMPSSATAARLNLGAHDWTLECWLRLEADARDEGVILEVSVAAGEGGPLVTRWSVLPAENAFALASLRPAAATASSLELRKVEQAAADGPVGSHVLLQTTTLALDPGAIPRGSWFHVALVHEASDGRIILFVGGKCQAEAGVVLGPLPLAGEMYVTIGCDGQGARTLAGALDEMRVSDVARYTRDGAPPESFAVARGDVRSTPAR
jgi:hypothetical protein